MEDEKSIDNGDTVVADEKGIADPIVVNSPVCEIACDPRYESKVRQFLASIGFREIE